MSFTERKPAPAVNYMAPQPEPISMIIAYSIHTMAADALPVIVVVHNGDADSFASSIWNSVGQTVRESSSVLYYISSASEQYKDLINVPDALEAMDSSKWGARATAIRRFLASHDPPPLTMIFKPDEMPAIIGAKYHADIRAYVEAIRTFVPPPAEPVAVRIAVRVRGASDSRPVLVVVHAPGKRGDAFRSALPAIKLAVSPHVAGVVEADAGDVDKVSAGLGAIKDYSGDVARDITAAAAAANGPSSFIVQGDADDVDTTQLPDAAHDGPGPFVQTFAGIVDASDSKPATKAFMGAGDSTDDGDSDDESPSTKVAKPASGRARFAAMFKTPADVQAMCDVISEGRPVMILFTKTGCIYCDKLKADAEANDMIDRMWAKGALFWFNDCSAATCAAALPASFAKLKSTIGRVTGYPSTIVVVSNKTGLHTELHGGYMGDRYADALEKSFDTLSSE